MSWYAIFRAGPPLAATNDGAEVGLSMATGGIGQSRIGRGFTLANR
jgi:hypothetical protein